MSNPFEVNFYGVRGSIPTPLTSEGVEEKLAAVLEAATPSDLVDDQSRKAFIDGLPAHVKGVVGGNSACVHVSVGGQNIIFDAGTGIRVLGLDLVGREFGKGEGSAHLIFSHTHWDHIMGLPFFGPLYIPGNKFNICGCHEDLPDRLKGQQQFQYFPISFDIYASDINFVDLSKMDQYMVGEAKVTWKKQYHPGVTWAYRVDYQGKSVVYATDAEYKDPTPEGLKETADFFRDADLVIFDSQYTMIEAMEKEDWGHSSTFIGIKLALQAGVKKMAFFHHEPTYSDFRLEKILQSSKEFLDAISLLNQLELILAMEGQSVVLIKG